MANLRFGAVEEAFKKRPLESSMESMFSTAQRCTSIYQLTSTISWLMLWITVFAWTVL